MSEATEQTLFEITVNGAARQVRSGFTIRDLVLEMGLQGPVAVERNREIVPRALHAETALVAGDTLEIVHFVGGG